MNEIMLRQAGLFIGLVLRLFLPAFYVWYNTPSFAWDHKYTKQFIYSLVLVFTAMIVGYTAPDPNLTPYQVFWFSIKDGILLKEAVNQIRKWDELRIEKIIGERDDD